MQGKGDGGEEILPFTEVAAAATGTAATMLRLAGNGLAFRTIYFPSSASFFRFPSYEMLGFFCYLWRFLYPLEFKMEQFCLNLWFTGLNI